MALEQDLEFEELDPNTIRKPFALDDHNKELGIEIEFESNGEKLYG